MKDIEDVRMITVKQAAELLGVGRWAIYRMQREGLIPRRVFPGRKRCTAILLADITTLVNSMTTKEAGRG